MCWFVNKFLRLLLKRLMIVEVWIEEIVFLDCCCSFYGNWNFLRRIFGFW